MKFTTAIFLLFIFSACSVSFQKQKYTDFRHGKIAKWHEGKSGVESAVDEVRVRNHIAPESIGESKPSLNIDKDTVTKQDLEKTALESAEILERTSLAEDTIFPSTPNIADDSVSTQNYIATIRHERNNNAIFGGISLVLLVATFLTGYIPFLVFFGALLFTFALITLLKNIRYNQLLRNPEYYPNPKDKPRFTKDKRKTARSLFITAIVLLFLLVLLLLFLLIMSVLLTLLWIEISVGLMWLVFPVGVILVLFMFSILIIRNYNRGRRLRGEEVDSGIQAIAVFAWILGLVTGLGTIFALFGNYLKDLYL